MLSPTTKFESSARANRYQINGRADLVIDHSGQKMFPCLIVERSNEGFRLRGNFKLKRGQIVELIADDPTDSVRCEVIWFGKPGSQQLVEAGLQMRPGK